ncbi:MAG: sigma-70 family RNA polymerase sigma factor [Mycobacteriales bacterium]
MAALDAGHPRGFAQVYDAYCDRLYAYCRAVIPDTAAASDATHDALVVAGQCIGKLRDPHRLRPWLYAVTRNECLRQHHRSHRKRSAARGGGDPVGPATDNPGSERELRAALRAALAGLDVAEREVLELGIRQGLHGMELALVLGLPEEEVTGLLQRARLRLEKAITPAAVAWTGNTPCPDLDRLLHEPDLRSARARQRIGQHLDGCMDCRRSGRRPLSGVALLASLPAPAPPLMLRGRVLETVTATTLAGHRAQLARQAAPFDEEGFPVPLDLSGNRAGPLRVAAAAVAALLVLGGVGAVWWGAEGSTPEAATELHGMKAPVVRADPTHIPPVLAVAPGIPSPLPRPSGPTPPGVPASPTPAASFLAGPVASGRPPSTGGSAGPTATPSPSPTGAFTVTPRTLTLEPGQSGTITVDNQTADPVSWSASVSNPDAVQMNGTSGRLDSYHYVTLTVTASSSSATTDSTVTITISPGGHTVTVKIVAKSGN